MTGNCTDWGPELRQIAQPVRHLILMLSQISFPSWWADLLPPCTPALGFCLYFVRRYSFCFESVSYYLSGSSPHRLSPKLLPWPQMLSLLPPFPWSLFSTQPPLHFCTEPLRRPSHCPASSGRCGELCVLRHPWHAGKHISPRVCPCALRSRPWPSEKSSPVSFGTFAFAVPFP